MIFAVAALLLLGSFLMFLTGLGLYRMPDIFTRMHAATKGASLGIALLLLAAAFVFRDAMVVTKALVTIAFVFLTAPVAAHLLARAAYARRTSLWEHSVVDEGRDHIAVDDRAPGEQEERGPAAP
ncbi:MAG: monovalent cation/H(+) antiporter subunit G [Chthoniobacterales bacterium]|jgi:multicomponent Na+:H+ antiporter subunit G